MQKILGHLRRAVDDYGMISEGDKICVGVSGGKDSTLLLIALQALSRFYPKKFSVVGISLDMGFPDTDFSSISDLCNRLGIEYTVVKTEIYKIVFDVRKEKNPCSLCSRLRRGALHNAAVAAGCNKLALGHHNDDVIETMMLNLLFEGRIGCFSPVTFLDRKQITVIRPLIYLTERQISSYVRRAQIPIVVSTCPANGLTQRKTVRERIEKMEREIPGFKEKTFGALQRSGVDGWGTDGVKRGRKSK